MNFDLLRLVLSLGLVALAFGVPRRERWLPGFAIVVAGATAGPGLWRYIASPEVRGWNVFHYYLGAEYYAELGYFDLYPAALAADREGRDAFAAIHRVRDQNSYEVEDREVAAARFAPTAHFSPLRWQAFVADVAALADHEGREDWTRVFVDRGYNATPFWSSFARIFTHLLPARHPVALKLLAGLDLVLLTVAGLALLAAFGREATLAVTLLFLLSPVDGERMIGGFLQYDWLAALALGLAALARPPSRGRALGAGVAFGYATLVRVFPVLFVATLLAPAAWRWLRTGRLSKRHAFLAGSFAVTLAIGFGIGCATPRGADAWRQFAGKIGFHAERHVLGDQRVGLQHLFTSDPLAGGDLADRPAEREAALARWRPLVWALGGLLLAAAGLVLRRRRGTAAFLLGLVPFYVLTVASRYYWATLAFLPLAARRPRASARILGLVAMTFAVFYGVRLAGAGRYGSYLVFDATLLGLAGVLLGSALARDHRVGLRLRARRR